MDIKKVITKECVCFLKSHTKEDVLLELMGLIKASGKIEDITELKEKIFHREELMSTGIGLGLALPHARMEGIIEPIVAIGASHEGIEDYSAIDDQLIKLVILIVTGKHQHKEYVKLLSSIIVMLKNTSLREDIFNASDIEQIYDAFIANSEV
jgi:mannitol/fructose-specific phosphotransferase system IIA component (Ntr-type)